MRHRSGSVLVVLALAVLLSGASGGSASGATVQQVGWGGTNEYGERDVPPNLER